jgi:hypothetical protein
MKLSVCKRIKRTCPSMHFVCGQSGTLEGTFTLDFSGTFNLWGSLLNFAKSFFYFTH